MARPSRPLTPHGKKARGDGATAVRSTLPRTSSRNRLGRRLGHAEWEEAKRHPPGQPGTTPAVRPLGGGRSYRTSLIQIIHMPSTTYVRGDESGALFRACKDGDASLVEELLAAGQQPNQANEYGFTPLHWACGDERTYTLDAAVDPPPPPPFAECVHLLLAANAEVDAMDKFKNRPLHSACLRGNFDCVEQLLEAGASVNAANQNGTTPLHCACTADSPEAVELLLEAGAVVDATDANDETPLGLAFKLAAHECIEALEAVGAKRFLSSKGGGDDAPPLPTPRGGRQAADAFAMPLPTPRGRPQDFDEPLPTPRGR